MDFHVTKASKILQCHETCVHFKGYDKAAGKTICDKLGTVVRPKPPCDCHSLKGYTGYMGKISQAMAYADQWNKDHTPKDPKEEKRGKTNVS